MFIEHIPRAERLQDIVQLATIDSTDVTLCVSLIPRLAVLGLGTRLSLPMQVWESPITVYNIVKLKRWGQMLRIIGNSWKKQPKQ